LKFISVDQSFASCAITYWEDNKALKFTVAKTSSSWVNNPNKKDVNYFPIITQQIDFVVNNIYNAFIEHNAEYCVVESPAQSGFGTAVASLKTLHRAIKEKFKLEGFEDKFFDITPTALKAYARDYLPEDMQTDGVLKSGKTKKIKMEKKHMHLACKLAAPDGWLDNNTVSNGGGDIADSFWLGHMFYHKMLKGV